MDRFIVHYFEFIIFSIPSLFSVDSDRLIRLRSNICMITIVGNSVKEILLGQTNKQKVNALACVFSAYE